MNRYIPIAIAILLALGACATQPQISANPVQDLAKAQPAPVVQIQTVVITGLQNASYNLDQAVIVGALDKTDPAPACVHGVLQQIGADVDASGNPTSTTPPSPSFTPKVSDLASAGSVLYIRAQQAKKLAASGGIQVPVGCEALIGKFVIDAGKAGIKVGAGLLPGLGVINGIIPIPGG